MENGQLGIFSCIFDKTQPNFPIIGIRILINNLKPRTSSILGGRLLLGKLFDSCGLSLKWSAVLYRPYGLLNVAASLHVFSNHKPGVIPAYGPWVVLFKVDSRLRFSTLKTVAAVIIDPHPFKRLMASLVCCSYRKALGNVEMLMNSSGLDRSI